MEDAEMRAQPRVMAVLKYKFDLAERGVETLVPIFERESRGTRVRTVDDPVKLAESRAVQRQHKCGG